MIEYALREIEGIVGSGNLLRDTANLYIFRAGAADLSCRGRADAIVHVTSRDQVPEIMKVAYKYEVPVIPRGGGSSVTGVVAPINGGIVLDLKALDKIVVDVDNGVVEAEAGATILDVDNECRKYGFFLPPDPASARIATVGGSIAENAGGMRGARYGVMRDWVLKLEVVLADGTLTYFGEAVYKNTAGYDLVGLMVGSEGTLGIITRAWLKIMPLPEKIVRIAGFFDRVGDAGRAIFRVRREGVNPLILEYADKEGIIAANRIKKFNYPEADGGMVLVDVDGPKIGVDYIAEKVVKIFKEENASTILKPNTPEEMESIMDVRRIAFTAPARLYPGFIDGDIVVPLSKIGDALAGIDEIRRKYNVFITVAGHAGDGNLHPNIGVNPNNRDEWERAEKAAYELNMLAVRLGGSIAAEHGIGRLKEDLLLKQFEARNQLAAYSLMKEIKKIFDPKNILNPGVCALRW